MPDLHEQLASALADRYVIERRIGAGGMATVYLARDLKHNRRVALKLLNPDLGAVVGGERFLSEIRVTANLQHPNLLPLFDSGEAGGLLYYVMPYVEGESLRQRLDRERQLPVDEAIRIATAVAGALDYAHQHGVIHRDLKPENILLQHGQPVVADFGIALAISNAGGERVTQTGLSLGTPQYMSPEQATGDRVIDARTDVYSLGAVTYEMLAGEPPHEGSTAQAIIAKLMTEVPRPIAILRHTVPDHVDDAVRCALEKLPADRFASAAQFAAALNGGPAPHHTRHPRKLAVRASTSRGIMAALAATAVLALTFAALWVRASMRPQPLLQFVLDTPDQHVAVTNESAVVLSPDGGTVAYTARNAGSIAPQIFVRPLASLYARPVATAGAPLFAADGRWLMYKTDSDIRRVPVDGGNAELVARTASWQGYAVSSKGEVVVAAEGSIWRVEENGSKRRLVAPDTNKGEASFAAPSFLNDNTIAFWIQRSDRAPGNGVGITTREGGEYAVLNLASNRPVGMLDGHLLLGTDQGTLLAYPLNLSARRITGPPLVLLDSVVWIAVGGLQLSIANDGSLAYLRGSSRRSMQLVDQSGAAIAVAPENADYWRGALAPDGKRVAVAIARTAIGGQNVQWSDVWTWDVEGKTLARFTTDGGDNPKWSPDGRRIAYLRRTPTSSADIMWAPADGSGAAEVLVPAPANRSIDGFEFALSGRTLLLTMRDSVSSDVYSIDLTSSDRTPKPLVATRFNESGAAVSPDGRWLAYVSDETGRGEVYVRPLRSPAGRVRITSRGGQRPEWITGSRLVYGDAGRRYIAQIGQQGDAITFVARDSLTLNGSREAVSASGERYLMLRDPLDWRIVIVKNWVAEAKRKLRASR